MSTTTLDRVIGTARRSPTFAVGFGVIMVFAFLAAFADVIAPLPPTLSHPYDTLRPPGTGAFILGTDGNGMDVLSRVIHGARYAFGIALPAGAIMAVVGIPLGLIAGWRGGWVDEVLLRVLDVLRAFPTIILALAIVAATGQGFLNVILVVGFLDSPIFARIVRAEVLALRNATFVRAAVAAGNPEWRVLLVHILPNAILGATAQLPLRMAWAVRISATLAFIGIGVQAPAPEWGAMIRQGAEYVISGEWWVALFPGLALIALVLGLNLTGDGLSDLLDPKRRATGK
ncbi:ABC transporter permease [Falsiroseomonas stagni]|uniref:Peptide/nickel transport system permease protein n=1 Tax=Falsiroseomonas stagni DSM 19981 TaxID=1123062 RepID=A0A1I4DVW0_9PROT|nr:ABC transporter permease [Falsiroseomonas stagni]SFK96800.1 peptide/nickel transport system permease protein [Falsiroseomonas stagni DSM 19981]